MVRYNHSILIVISLLIIIIRAVNFSVLVFLLGIWIR